jgi:SAM-dependent methyltransferase
MGLTPSTSPVPEGVSSSKVVSPVTSASISSMRLYNLQRVYRTLAPLSRTPVWTPEDTSSFDCMHYLGTAALDHAAKQLNIQASERVLDVGSGFGLTGRYLRQHFGALTTGIELQTEIHLVAELVNRRQGMPQEVYSVNADVLGLSAGEIGGVGSFDHLISFLTILHIPDRAKLFACAAAAVKPGGKLYIEDYYAADEGLDAESSAKLRDWVACSYLPPKQVYMADLAEAGFGDIGWEDVSEEWSVFVHERSLRYKSQGDTEAGLKMFCDTIDGLFREGKVKGARITAERL